MKEGWEYRKLGEVCEKSKNIRWEEIDDNKSFSYIDLSSVDRDSFSIVEPQTIIKATAPSRAKQVVNEGDILFATTRPTLRRVCLIPNCYDGQICSTGFCVLRPKKDVDSKWIYYLLQADDFYHYIEPLQTGANYPAVTDSIVKDYPMCLPPLSEQQSIVDYLDSAFAKIDAMKANAEKALNEAKALFQASLKEMLEPKEGWEVKTLKETAKYRRGSFPQPYGNREWYDGEGSMPFVQVAELQEDSFNLISVTKKRISKLAQPLSVFVPAGTVLVSLQGSIGKVAITDYDSYVDRTVAIFQDYKIEIDRQ